MRRRDPRERSLPPIMGGAIDLEGMLKSIQDELEQNRTKQQSGSDDQDLKQRIESLEQQKALVEQELEKEKAKAGGNGTGEKGNDGAGGGEQKPLTPEEELSQLREYFRTKQLEDLATRAADVAEAAYKNAQEEQQKQLSDIVDKAVRSRLGLTGGAGATLPGANDIGEVVRKELQGIRMPSSFLGMGASPDAVAELQQRMQSAGGLQVQDSGAIKNLGDRDVKQFMESKQFARLFGAIRRLKQNVATDVDRKALAELTDASGGYLVPPDWMPDLLGLIRAQAVVRAANPRVVPLRKQMNQVAVSSGATAYYVAENAAITESEMTFSQTVLLTPKNLTGLVPISNILLDDEPEAEQTVREELAEVLALAEDFAFLQGTGPTDQMPLGLLNQSGITDMTANPFVNVPANGRGVTDTDIRRMIAQTRILNVRGGRLAFFFHPAVLTQLELLKDSTGRYLLDTGVLQLINPYNAVGNDTLGGQIATGPTGTIWGVPFYTTTQIPTNMTRGTATTATYVLLVNMAETIVGLSKDLTIDASSEASYVIGTTQYNAFQLNQTVYRSIMRHDIGHRRPQQIIVLQGILS